MMILLRKTPVKGLCHWLEIATEKLAAPAKERVRWEIEAHYTEAVAAHIAEGASEPDAKAAALAELGDPKAAGWHFRRRHLTESQARRVERMRDADQSVVGLVNNYVTLFIFSYVGPPYRDHVFWAAGVLLCFLVLPTISFVTTKCKHGKSDIRPILLIRCLYVFATPALLCENGPHHSVPYYWIGIPLLLGLFSYTFIFLLPIWFKLREAGEIWAPPTNATPL